MANKPIDVSEIIQPDLLGTYISDRYLAWEGSREDRLSQWKELQQYIFSTSTRTTSNSKLPWSNSTVLPKLCQIRDNLHANYMAAMFPKRKWMEWQGNSDEDETREKKEVVESYMSWVVDRNQYYDTVSRLVYDYIDYGNVFTMPEWHDGSSIVSEDGLPKERFGYVGPQLRRISPLDIVFDPTAPSFEQAPKIIRSIVSIGEIKEMLEQTTGDEDDKEAALALYDYLKGYRANALSTGGDLTDKDDAFYIAGFSSFRDYLESNSVEVLTLYGDIYDEDSDTLLKNYIVKVVDRHKVIFKEPNPSYFGSAPIYHCGWRLRPDNLWAMGPLDNLVGMQYRIDHLENLKADVFDLIAYPVVKIKGVVEDFTWGPMEKIYIGDDGDVNVMSPDVQALQADTQIAILEAKMEEMAGAPKEAMGFRTPGEKTKYEVQSMENASSRIFMSKIAYFERHIVENALNGMLELARRNIQASTIRIIDDEYKMSVFLTVTPLDLTGQGRIKPFAARHFAEQSQMVQNLSNFYNSAAGADQDVRVHFSSIKLAKLWEYLLEIEDHEIVQPFIRLSEQADGQRMANSHQESVAMETMTPNGFSPGDFDQDVLDSVDLESEGSPAEGSVPTSPQ